MSSKVAGKVAWPLSNARYVPTARLGGGTFGNVFAATRISNWEKTSEVALKVVSRWSAHASRELELMLKLRERPHPNVISMHEYFFLGSPTGTLLLCQVMPRYLESLGSLLRRDPGNAYGRVARAQAVGQDMAAALLHIHETHNIIHRDLKPENVLVHSDGSSARSTFVLADFGCSKRLEPKATATQPNDCRMCAPLYRAPELLFGSESYTYSPDVWGFGCVLAEVLLGGRPLFDATDVGIRTERAGPEPTSAAELEEGRQAREHRQRIRVLVHYLGTPLEHEVIAMNPAFTASLQLRAQLRALLRVPRRPAAIDPQELVARAFEASPELTAHVNEARQLLGAILRWDPHSRPTARALLQAFKFLW